MTGASLDTNILLRWILNDIPAQARAAEKLINSGVTLHVADAAVNEVVYVLEKGLGFPRKRVAVSIRSILAAPNISCNRNLYEVVLPIYVTYHNLSIVDCYLVVRADRNNFTPLYTFDKKLASQLGQAKLLK